MEDDVFYGIAVEKRKEGIDVSGVINWYAIQQDQVLVVGTSVDLQVVACRRAADSWQDPDL